MQQLAGLSMDMHRGWAGELYEETGIDTQYRQPGEIHVAYDDVQHRQLESSITQWNEQGLGPQPISTEELADREPHLERNELRLAVFLPESAQVRNPHHLSALIASCRRRGVEIVSAAEVHDLKLEGGKIQSVLAGTERYAAEQVCLAAGTWTGRLAERLGIQLAIKPIRGQIALLRQEVATFDRVINLGLRYLVPRRDGRVLVGSTMEDVGFLKQTTTHEIVGLLSMAHHIVPSLAEVEIERTWAGLRPATVDKLPYMGKLPGVDNGFIAAGHFRQGLQLSTASAKVMAELICGEPTTIPLEAFRIDRH